MRQVYEKLLRSGEYANLSSKSYLEDLAGAVLRLFGEGMHAVLR